MKRLKILLLAIVACACGCMTTGEVSQADAVKQQNAFSQDAYEQAMIKAGKGKELEEEKKRNAEYMKGGQ